MINFPNNPAIGDSVTSGEVTYYWDGEKWKVSITATTTYLTAANPASTGTFTHNGNDLGRWATVDPASKVNATTTISTGTGLTGGGNLSANRTISLANTAVAPGTYTLATVTVDAQGRLTSAGNGSVPAPQWSAIQGKPTSLSGYGITMQQSDVVTALGYTPYNFGAGTPWHSGNFNPDAKMSTTGGWFTDWFGLQNATNTQKTFIQCTPDGNVVFNNTAWTASMFYITQAGSAHASIFRSTSDVHKKRNFAVIESALDKCDVLLGYTYLLDGQSKRTAGLISQDAARVIPEAVSVDKYGTQSMDYNAITALLVNAINELKDEVRTLMDEVRTLKETTHG